MSHSGGFLNNLNPIAKSRRSQLQTLHNYEQASSLLEEDENAENDYEEQQGIPLSSSKRLASPRSKAIATLEVDQSPKEHRADVEQGLDASDEEVPHSFMVETSPNSRRRSSGQPSRSHRSRTTRSRSQRNRAVASSSLLPTTHPIHMSTRIPHPDDIEEEDEEEQNAALPSSPAGSSKGANKGKGKPRSRKNETTRGGLDEHQQALWRWVNVYNLDEYLQEVYHYYANSGFTSIALSRVLNLLTVGFVIAFTTFLWGCIDYPKLSRIGKDGKGGHLHDVVIPRCVTRLPPVPALFLILFSTFYAYQLLAFFLSLTRLYQMRDFYTHLLKIPDVDISTVPWSTVVARISSIRDENPITAIGNNAGGTSDEQGTGTAKLDAHDTANRIMRQENYLIAMFNKDLLDLRLPIPTIAQRILSMVGIYQEESTNSAAGTTLTRALEWNLRFCLMDFLFDRSGRVKDVFLKERNRETLVEELKKRFIFMGLLNALFLPFIIPYLLIYSFFRYFEEAQRNPSSISSRRYTPYAEWKFREFNELPHLFSRRLDTSYPTANMYLDQYPQTTTSHVARFVSFIAGSFAGVLILASLLDPELVLRFEITQGRTVLFWIGIFGAILAVSRGMIRDGHLVFDPEILMKEVIRHTHYMLEWWKGELHSEKVHQEFSKLFTMKVMIFVQEILSVVLNPLILTLALPKCAPEIIDFFREFTIHIDTLGYVCSFAVFDFRRHGNIKFGAPSFGEDTKDGEWQQDERFQSKDGKMEKSFLAFKAAHPEWTPTDPTGSLYLERLREMHHEMSHPVHPLSRKPTATAFGIGSTALARSTLAERSEIYERALAQSMANARIRRGPSTNLHMTTAQSSAQQADQQYQEDDRADDGGIDSHLGDSYVDDVRRRGGQVIIGGAERNRSRQEEEDVEADELANGGVLGLLAQIYDRKRPVIHTHHQPPLVALGSLLESLQKIEQQQGGISDDKTDQSQQNKTQKLSKEALEKLAERLHALVGEEFELSGEPPVNEDGLPIVEVMEPASEAYTRSDFIPAPPTISPPRTEVEKIGFRKARDAFIAALEEEEQRDEEQARREEETEFMKAIKQAKEKVQELRTSENTQANSGQLSSLPRIDEKQTVSKEGGKTRKSVSFAQDAKGREESHSLWGDVRQGRLRGLKSGQGTMKLEIVERMPSNTSTSPSTRRIDSDDEDEEDEDGESVEHESEGDDSDAIDFDEAMEQREVALRYHELRQSLGKGPQEGPLGGPIDGGKDDEWDQENVPLEASLAEQSRGKQSSRFMASRLNERSMKAVLPEGLQGEIRHGTLVDNQLVTGDGEGASDGELNERGKRIVDGLTKGMTVEDILAQEHLEEIDNEPDLNEVERKPPEIKQGVVMGEVREATHRSPKAILKSEGKPIKVSRFKANRIDPEA
ncbi:autophagy protein atg9 [Serendipita sp. 399]|nr:autophagy protein atg9 [Serendipita sp. 399]